MALREETVIDKIEVLESGVIQYRRARRFYDGDTLLTETYHRDAPLEPGADVEGKDERVRRIAGIVWTPDVVAAHAARKARDAGNRGRS